MRLEMCFGQSPCPASIGSGITPASRLRPISRRIHGRRARRGCWLRTFGVGRPVRRFSTWLIAGGGIERLCLAKAGGCLPPRRLCAAKPPPEDIFEQMKFGRAGRCCPKAGQVRRVSRFRVAKVIDSAAANRSASSHRLGWENDDGMAKKRLWFQTTSPRSERGPYRDSAAGQSQLIRTWNCIGPSGLWISSGPDGRTVRIELKCLGI